ncbi:MAG: M20/M25/M40 family metallo-hydrolase [Bacteroidota bacterium]
MRALLPLLILLVGVVPDTVAQDAQSSVDLLREMQMDVAYLASDLLEGRAPGTEGEALAAAHLIARFEALGLEPAGTEGYLQPFTFNVAANPHAMASVMQDRSARNVVALLDHGAPRTIVVGAHYDHLGYGGEGSGSRQPADSLIHNGADDNASGTAAMLAIARRLTADDAPRSHNVLFLGFSAEETGLHGSKFFVENPAVPLESIAYMINLDMVGRLGPERDLVVSGTGTSPAWGAALDVAEATHEINVARSESGVGASDHTSFYLRDIPVVHLFTGAHDDYHKPIDDSHLIDYEGLVDISAFAVTLIEELDDDGEIAFTKTQDSSQSSPMSFRVSLGVMPDYAYQGDGMRIDAVLDDRPGSRAGLQNGDVVIRLGEIDVADIYDYMEALAQHDPGQTAPLVVMRNGERVETNVTF